MNARTELLSTRITADSRADISECWAEMTGNDEVEATAYFAHDEATGHNERHEDVPLIGTSIDRVAIHHPSGWTEYLYRHQAAARLGEACMGRIESVQFDRVNDQ